MRLFWKTLLVLAIVGCLVSIYLRTSYYYDIRDLGSLIAAAAMFAVIIALIAIPGKRRHPVILGAIIAGIALLGFGILFSALISTGKAPASRIECMYNLQKIGIAMHAYREDNNGYFPFDQRGPLYSLSLLYPRYLADPSVFECPSVSRMWKRRDLRNSSVFPPGTSLAGSPCHYGYTWHVSPNSPGDFAIVADLPVNHYPHGYNVSYADAHVGWNTTPFCSHDVHDNIFAPEPGWSADTDSYIRQK